MPVITLSREMGSHGDTIALAVAERLKLKLAGRELINRAAREAGAPEVALAEIDELGLLGVKPGPAALQLYREKVTEAILMLARQGNVLLVGRSGQIVLADWPDVLRVRVLAPRETRIRLVQERCHVTPEIAAARIDASDKARADFLKRHYGVYWEDPQLYDLVLNMVHLDVLTAVDLICLASERLEHPDEKRLQNLLTSEAEGCECR